MDLATTIPPIPADTYQAAKSIYSGENYYLMVGDRLADLLDGAGHSNNQVTRLISRLEKPSLAMASIFQFIELLSDPQVNESTRTRVDWKYALHLSINYPGLPGSILCQYRQKALQDQAMLQDLQSILDRMEEVGLQNCRLGKMVTASRMLDENCSVTRFELLLNALESAMGTLAIHQPEWLRGISLPHWYTHYHIIFSSRRSPLNIAERDSFTEAIGADACYLLESFFRDAKPEWYKMQEIQVLRRICMEQFEKPCTHGMKLKEGCSYCNGGMKHESIL